MSMKTLARISHIPIRLRRVAAQQMRGWGAKSLSGDTLKRTARADGRRNPTLRARPSARQGASDGSTVPPVRSSPTSCPVKRLNGRRQSECEKCGLGNRRRNTKRLGQLAVTLAAGTSLMAPVAAAADTHESEPLKVVASFTVLADIAENIGGDDVSVDSLVGPDSDSHVFEPSPSHVQALAGADIVVVNGLAFEGWMDRLIDASGFDGSVIVASANAGVIESGNDHHDHEEDGHDQDDDDGHEEEDHDQDHGPEDAHAWQSVSEGRSYAQTIADALAEADPDNADAYRDRLAGYDAELEALDHEVRELMGEIPDGATTVIVPHASFTYFERDYGIEFLSPSGLTTEAEPTAAQMAGLVDLIHEHGVAAILAENVSSPRMVELLAEEAGMSLGGTLYSDALSEQDGPAPTYIEMLRHNAAVIHRAITR